MNIVNNIVDNKIEGYNFLNEVIEILSLYENQKNRKLFISQNITLISQDNINNASNFNINDIKIFLDKNTFKNDYKHIHIDDFLIKKFNLITNTLLNHNIQYECKLETLSITSYNILISELDEAFNACKVAKKIEILAQNILFLDKDMTNDYFKGKTLIIIAPIWNIIGKRIINVSGNNGKDPPHKAATGMIGMDDNDGQDSGNVIGIGMKFNNEDKLAIIANGGNGGNGQDGGNGINGKNGIDYWYGKEQVADSGTLFITLVFNAAEYVYIERGTEGKPGGNSGSGGKGGSAGNKGTMIIHNTEELHHAISVQTINGKKRNKWIRWNTWKRRKKRMR